MDLAGNPQLDNAEYAEKMAAFDVEDDMETWKKSIKQYIADNRDVDPVVRTYPLEEAAQRFLDKEITREEYLNYIDEYKPVTGWDQLPREPSTKAMVYSLKPNQIEKGSFVLTPEEAAKLGVKESSLSIGDFFDGRLDVTAYKEFDTWIVAGAKTGEKGQHYAKAVHYQGGDGQPVILLNSDNPKKYETNIRTGERIGAAQQNPRGETYGKTPYAAISGYVKDLDVDSIRKQAEQLLNDPEWVQLGFDPRRQGNFYVRREKANTPLHAVATSAEEVIQIGPLVLAKNPVLDLDYEGYNEGGMAKADFESLEAYKEFLMSLDDIAEFRDRKGDKYSESAKRINTFSYPSRKTSPITKSEKGVPLTIAGNELLKHKEYKDEYFSNNPSHEIIKADGTKDREFSYRLDRKSGAAEGATFLDALVAEFEVLANKEAEDKISEKEQALLDSYRVFLTERTGMNEGGMAMDEQMNAVFKSSRTGYAVGGSVDLDSVPDNTVGMDPVSGNEIPLGSLPEEVRDDIPAQLSEGEYVVPADVVRYYGVKFFEDLRADAKFGYQDMEENGRIGGEPPMGMEMVEPEDDMMFDISELEVMEVPDEPEGAFFGKLFGKKEEKSPEDSVRERFEAAKSRDNSAKGIARRQAERRAAAIARQMAESDDGGPSIAEQINFGGDYEDVSSSSSSSKSKPKKDSAASKTVRRAYTGAQEDDGKTFAEKINFGGKYNQGGYALNPGDPGYDEMGSLGLGSEGLPLGAGQGVDADAVIEMVAYVNEEGRVIYILHINGVPQNEIPPGFYMRTEEEDVTEEDATDAQPEAQAVAQSDDDGGPDMTMPTPIQYQTLTTDELSELMNDITDPKNKAVMLGIGAMMGPAGLLVKGAMMHQESRLRKEIQRRLDGELTTQDRTRLETMYQQMEDKKGGLFGALKDTVTDLVIGEEQGPNIPETYTPEVAAGDVTTPDVPTPESIITTTELPDMEAFRQAGQDAAESARRKVIGVTTPPSISSESDPNVIEARSSARQGTQDVLDSMRDRGASPKARTAAVKEGARIESVLADQARGIKRGFKKGGLASKKKKK